MTDDIYLDDWEVYREVDVLIVEGLDSDDEWPLLIVLPDGCSNDSENAMFVSLTDRIDSSEVANCTPGTWATLFGFGGPDWEYWFTEFEAEAIVCHAGVSEAPAHSSNPLANSCARVTGVDVGNSLRIRACGSVQCDIVGGLAHDERGIMLGACEGDWCEVSHRGIDGWSHSGYLRADDTCGGAQASSSDDTETSSAESCIAAIIYEQDDFDVYREVQGVVTNGVVEGESRPITMDMVPDGCSGEGFDGSLYVTMSAEVERSDAEACRTGAVATVYGYGGSGTDGWFTEFLADEVDCSGGGQASPGGGGDQPPTASGELIDRVTADAVVDALTEEGATNFFLTGDDFIQASHGDLTFFVWLEACEGPACRQIVFRANFDIEELGPEEAKTLMDDWNRTSVFGYAAIDGFGFPSVRHGVDLRGGMSRANLRANVATWLETLSDFAAYVGW